MTGGSSLGWRAVKIKPCGQSDSGSDASEVHAYYELEKASSLSVWKMPFDCTRLPEGVVQHMVDGAPFLMGLNLAVYTKKFFVDTGGLCGSGYPFKKLVEDDLFPIEDIVRIFPLSKTKNRHPLKFITDKEAAIEALHMYQRVYGGMQPDNGEFGTQFIRGFLLQNKRNKQVNFAAKAQDLATLRAKSPGNNPQKLLPPCIREQIQALIDIFASEYLAIANSGKNTTSSRKHSSYRRSGLGQPMCERSIPTADIQLESLASAKLSSVTAPVAKRSKRTANRSNEDQSTRMPPPRAMLKDTPLQALLTKRRSAEGRLLRLRDRLEKTHEELTTIDLQLKQDIIAEGACWDEQAELRKQSKQPGLEESEIAKFNSAVREKGKQANRFTKSVEATKELLATKKADCETCEEQINTLQDEISVTSESIDVLLVESSCIRPNPYIEKLRAEALVPTELNMKASEPCAGCAHFFIDQALVPMSCGCLFHPYCIFRMAIVPRPTCPRYFIAPTTAWMVQWGFANNNDSKQISMKGASASMHALGWGVSDVDAAAVSAKLAEVSAYVMNWDPVATNSRQMVKRKQDRELESSSPTKTKTKRHEQPCGSNPLSTLTTRPTSPNTSTIMEVLEDIAHDPVSSEVVTK